MLPNAEHGLLVDWEGDEADRQKQIVLMAYGLYQRQRPRR